jgi:hypothetical protein
MTLDEFLRAAGGHGPCVGLLLTPTPSSPPDGVEFRSVDAQQIFYHNSLFDAFAEAWNYPARFSSSENSDTFNAWMCDLNNLTNPRSADPAARGYITELQNAHLFLPNQRELFAWFANAISLYREYYRDDAEPSAAFGLLLSAPRNQLIAVQSRWLEEGVQIALVEALAAEEAYLTVSIGLQASENATKYKNLIGRFINEEVSAVEFQISYCLMFTMYADTLAYDELDILRHLYTSAGRYAADSDPCWKPFAADPKLRQYLQQLDEQQLRNDAYDAYWQLFDE